MRGFQILNEVVLYSPVEAALAPWIRRAPTPASKQWLSTNFKNWLSKSTENLYKLPYLPINADERQRKAFSFDDLYDVRLTPHTQNQLEHIMDFFDNNKEIPRLERMSVDNVVQAADQWVKQMNKAASKIPDDPKEVKTIMEFPGGYRMVDLIGQKALAREGSLMGHCVGGGSYCDFVTKGQGHIYSLRDSQNEPHATIQIMADKTTAQIKGRSNRAPVRRYWPMIRDFFDSAGIKVNSDHHNIGLLRIQDNKGGYVTMTQDQFKDMILDPNNEEGTKLLQSMGGNTDFGSDDDDMTMGMFTALYGTERLANGIIDHVFARMPDHAIQVVEHFGNKLNDEQLVHAFRSMYGDRNPDDLANRFKALLIATKPDQQTVIRIIEELQGKYRSRTSTSDNTFVIALSQVMPDSYMALLSDEDGIKRELSAKNARAAGPFFAFVGKGEYIDLMPQMIEKAFEFKPVDALKRIIRVKFGFDNATAIAAFTGLSNLQWKNHEIEKVLEQLIAYVQPDHATVIQIIKIISENHEDGGRFNETKTDIFVVALSQVVPATYMALLADEGGIQRELESKGVRAAGPFFVFAGKGEHLDQMPEMINEAFSHKPADAIKRIEDIGFVFDHDTIIGAFAGMSHHYWRNHDLDTVLEQLIAYVKPDTAMMSEILADYEGYRGQDYTAKLLIAAKKIVPESLDKETVERTLLMIDKDDMTLQYLADEPHPGLAMQMALFKRENGQTSWKTFVHAMQNVDPSIYRAIYQRLRPKKVPTTKEDYRNVRDKAAIAKGQAHATKQIKFNRPLKPDEIAKQTAANYREAIKKFSEGLSPAIHEPSAKIVAPLDPTSPKFRAGQQVFAEMGKSSLFDLAARYIDRISLKDRVVGDGGRGMSWHQDRPDYAEFERSVATMPTKDIVHAIDDVGYQRELFSLMINHAPQRVPDVMANQRLRTHHNNEPQWGKLDWKGLNKDKAFEALEYVWASKKVPAGYKDDFTLKVFKRFKPGPARLIELLEKADDGNAVAYVLKKTKNPSVALLNYVFNSFPDLIIEEVKNVPDPIVVRAFKEDRRLAMGLMNRDLRGWGTGGERRRTWSTYAFHSKIDPKSEAYRKYAAAAQAADTTDFFETYVRKSQLDELPVNGPKGLNTELLLRHLYAYANVTLARISSGDHTYQAIDLYFKHFDAEKMSQIAMAGGFGRLGNQHGYNQEPKAALFRNVDRTKLYDMVKILIEKLKNKKNSKVLEPIIKQMHREGLELDDEMLKNFISMKSISGSDVKYLINDKISDDVKDFIADHLPHLMEEIRTPTPHMVERLYDLYGTLNEKRQVNYWMKGIVMDWFKAEGGHWFKYAPNPVAAGLMKAEAKRRGGIAIPITRAIFTHLAALKQKGENGEEYLSTHDDIKVGVLTPPRKADIKNDGYRANVETPVEDTEEDDDDE